jgi:hypothetical protein
MEANAEAYVWFGVYAAFVLVFFIGVFDAQGRLMRIAWLLSVLTLAAVYAAILGNLGAAGVVVAVGLGIIPAAAYLIARVVAAIVWRRVAQNHESAVTAPAFPRFFDFVIGR